MNTCFKLVLTYQEGPECLLYNKDFVISISKICCKY